VVRCGCDVKWCGGDVVCGGDIAWCDMVWCGGDVVRCGGDMLWYVRCERVM